MRSAVTRLQWLRGWLSFVLVFSLDAIGNVGVTSYLFGQEFNGDCPHREASWWVWYGTMP
ncbi:MAG: hypothetical protein ACXWWE_04815 [Nitrospira sp.]